MAVPSSGSISMLGIFSEKNEDDYSAANLDGENTLSLRGLSSNSHNDSTGGNINLNSATANKPDQVAPHNMSEFRSYDHDVYVPIFSGGGPKIIVYSTTPSPDPYSVSLATQSQLGSTRIYNGTSFSINTGGQSIVGKGFVWSTYDSTPTLGSTIPDSNSHDVTLNGFEYGTLYYMRAWARLSGGGIGYSAVTQFYPTAGPVLTTQAVTNIGDNGATFTGNMTDNGVPDNLITGQTGGNNTGANQYQTKKGWIVSNNSTPTHGNALFEFLITTSDQNNAQWYGEGSFSKAFTGLTSGQTYYARAFAIMSTLPNNTREPGRGSTLSGSAPYLGYGYGNTVSFTTTQTLVGLAVTSTSYPKAVFACGQSDTTTRYFPDTSPAVGDTVYTNSAGTATLSAGHYGLKEIGSSSTNKRFTVDSSGEITVFTSC